MKYEYQDILDARKQQEKALRLQLADLDRRIDAWRKERREMVEQQRTVLTELNKKATGTTGNNPRSQFARLKALKKQMNRCAMTVAELEQRKEELRSQLQEIGKSRKLMEEHRDKARAEAEQKVKRNERKNAASHAIYSFFDERKSQ